MLLEVCTKMRTANGTKRGILQERLSERRKHMVGGPGGMRTPTKLLIKWTTFGAF